MEVDQDALRKRNIKSLSLVARRIPLDKGSGGFYARNTFGEFNPKGNHQGIPGSPNVRPLSRGKLVVPYVDSIRNRKELLQLLRSRDPVEKVSDEECLFFQVIYPEAYRLIEKEGEFWLENLRWFRDKRKQFKVTYH